MWPSQHKECDFRDSSFFIFLYFQWTDLEHPIDTERSWNNCTTTNKLQGAGIKSADRRDRYCYNVFSKIEITKASKDWGAIRGTGRVKREEKKTANECSSWKLGIITRPRPSFYFTSEFGGRTWIRINKYLSDIILIHPHLQTSNVTVPALRGKLSGAMQSGAEVVGTASYYLNRPKHSLPLEQSSDCWVKQKLITQEDNEEEKK